MKNFTGKVSPFACSSPLSPRLSRPFLWRDRGSIQPTQFALQCPSRVSCGRDALPREKWEGVEEQQVSFCPHFSCSSVRREEGSAVPQHLNSAGEPTAGFFCETPPVTVSISELERHQGYTAPKSYHCPLCFISPFTLPLQLRWEPYPRCFPNMTHSSAYRRRERVQTHFPARC